MKALIKIAVLVVIGMVVLMCTQEEELLQSGKVQFALGFRTSGNDGGRMSSIPEFPIGSYVSISVTTDGGTPVHSFKRIELIKLGDGYITSPLAMAEGKYLLTDFMVMSADGITLYATPKAGSPLSSLVNAPLPVDFEISANRVQNLDVQVVDTMNQSPEDFGYVSFGVEIVGTDFSVSLFSSDDGNQLNFTDGTISIFRNEELVHTQALNAEVNSVLYKGDPNTMYRLVIEKTGYSTMAKDYILSDLIAELRGKPMVVIVKPAITFTAVPNMYEFQFRIYSENKEFLVDWGDGTIEKPNFINGEYIGRHNYNNPAPGANVSYVNVTGDLESVTGFFIGTTLPREIAKLDITQLTELEELTTGFTKGPEKIDLSKNTKLKSLYVSYSNLKELDISKNPLLSFLAIEGISLTSENLNNVIKDLHEHAVSNETQGGTLSFELYGHDGEIQITDESILKLRDLQDNYGWFLIPSL